MRVQVPARRISWPCRWSGWCCRIDVVKEIRTAAGRVADRWTIVLSSETASRRVGVNQEGRHGEAGLRRTDTVRAWWVERVSSKPTRKPIARPTAERWTMAVGRKWIMARLVVEGGRSVGERGGRVMAG